MTLSDDQTVERDRAIVIDNVQERISDALKGTFEAQSIELQLLKGLSHGNGLALDKSLEKGLLAFEVPIDRALGSAHAGDDFADADGVIAVLKKEFCCRVEDGLSLCEFTRSGTAVATFCRPPLTFL